MMATLHQPKWRKFLTLKGEQNKANGKAHTEEIKGDTQTNDVPLNSTNPVSPKTKKRQRSAEEIAARKAKKLKSKAEKSHNSIEASVHNETRNLSSKDEEETHVDVGNSGDSVDEVSEVTGKGKDPALLAEKAREIAKKQREQKVQDRQDQKEPQVVEKEEISDERVHQLFDYLHRYEMGTGWKFKKAEQKWMEKHLYEFDWADKEVVILKYIGNMRGFSRRRVMTNAKKIGEEGGEQHGEEVLAKARKVVQVLEYRGLMER